MAFNIECPDPEYVKALGALYVANGHSIGEGQLFTGDLQVREEVLACFTRGIYQKRPTVDAWIEASKDELRVFNLKGSGKKGGVEFAIPHLYVVSNSGLAVIINLAGKDFRCKIIPEVTLAAPLYKPWESRKYGF
jgi:hypothetical protein